MNDELERAHWRRQKMTRAHCFRSMSSANANTSACAKMTAGDAVVDGAVAGDNSVDGNGSPRANHSQYRWTIQIRATGGVGVDAAEKRIQKILWGTPT